MQPNDEPRAADRGESPEEGKRLFPYNTVVGVIDDPEHVVSAVDTLATDGFTEGNVQVLCGEPGIRRIDAEGKRKGLLGRIFRVVDRMGPEHGHTARHVQALEDGGYVVIVEAHDDDAKLRARDAMAANGGHFINYYSRWTAETLDP
jgi:hypothetical protein